MFFIIRIDYQFMLLEPNATRWITAAEYKHAQYEIKCIFNTSDINKKRARHHRTRRIVKNENEEGIRFRPRPHQNLLALDDLHLRNGINGRSNLLLLAAGSNHESRTGESKDSDVFHNSN